MDDDRQLPLWVSTGPDGADEELIMASVFLVRCWSCGTSVSTGASALFGAVACPQCGSAVIEVVARL
jgi:predicted RNA-binding Zn-ribbon protein involved in translation (DUF1610 family)